MIPLFKIEWIFNNQEGNDILMSAYINPDMIIAVEGLNRKNHSAIEMRGGGTRYDVRKPEELNMALIVHCSRKS